MTITPIKAWVLPQVRSMQQECHLHQLEAIKPWMSQQLEEYFQQELPNRRQELWKYTSLDFLTSQDFSLSRYPKEKAVDFNLNSNLKQFTQFDLAQSIRFVFINGYFSEELSSSVNLPKGVIAMSLLSAWQQYPSECQQFMEAFAPAHLTSVPIFMALNGALITDGLYLHIPKNIKFNHPIHILHINTATENSKTMSHLRHFLSVGQSSEVEIFEEYVGENTATYFTTGVNHINLEKQARVKYYKLQRESAQSVHFTHTLIHQEQDSFASHASIALGAKISRDDLAINLQKSGASCELYGLYFPKHKQHIANYSTIHHQASHTQSKQHYRGIIASAGEGVFNGKVKVYPDTIRVCAKQENHNLLLAQDAVMNTKPELEIYADDVSCTHGATIGQLNKEALFYLQSRGVNKEQAYKMLMQGFTTEVLELMSLNAITEYMGKHIIKDIEF